MDKPAFPSPEEYAERGGHLVSGGPGLSRRELFAAMAMQGFMANKDRPQHFHPEDDAEWCVRIADALIAELDK